MKNKWLWAFFAIVFTGFLAISTVSAQAQAQPSETAETQAERGATEVPLENPDEPIVEEVEDAIPLETVPQVDTTRDAENITLDSAPDSLLRIGAPRPWQMNFAEGGSPSKEKMNDFHNFLLVIITAITLLVMFLRL